jgi:hypothetical protein
MDEVYLNGWEGARMAFHSGSAYVPIACITSRSETNETQFTQKVNVCTQGKPVTKANAVVRTVSINGEVVDSNSLDALRNLQDSLSEQTFRVYRTSGDTSPVYFKGIITSLSADYNAGDGTDSTSTFSMTVQVNGDYLNVDPES